MSNEVVRRFAAGNGVKLWQVAEVLGIADGRHGIADGGALLHGGFFNVHKFSSLFSRREISIITVLTSPWWLVVAPLHQALVGGDAEGRFVLFG